MYSGLSNKRGVFLILFMKIFPTQRFFIYINGNNVPTPRLFQNPPFIESSELFLFNQNYVCTLPVYQRYKSTYSFTKIRGKSSSSRFDIYYLGR